MHNEQQNIDIFDVTVKFLNGEMQMTYQET